MSKKLDQHWFKEAGSQIEDPLLASVVRELGHHVNEVCATAEQDDRINHLAATMEVCRTSQHIRVQVGDMLRMDSSARSKVQEALQIAQKAFLTPESFSGDERSVFEEAVSNISYRFDLTKSEEPTSG